MPTELWTGLTSRGTVLGSELDALGNAAYSAAGSTVVDNATNLDRFGLAELTVTFGSAPTADAPVHLYAVYAPDGTNYADGGGSVRPADLSLYLGTFQVRAVTTAQRIQTPRFELKPAKLKVVAYNGSGQAFPASGSVVTLYTFNRSIT